MKFLWFWKKNSIFKKIKNKPYLDLGTASVINCSKIVEIILQYIHNYHHAKDVLTTLQP